MRIFVYEFTCATPGWSNLPTSLRAEGRAMLAAVVADFVAIADLDVCTLLADDCAAVAAGQCVRSAQNEEEGFRKLAAAADYTLVIAPEFDDLLLQRHRWIEAAGGRSLGCWQHGITLTADKLALAQHWHRAGVQTPVTQAWPWDRERAAELSYPAVVKHPSGAGSQGLLLLPDAGAGELFAGGRPFSLLWQPFIPGQPASVAFLLGPHQRLALLPATQNLSANGCFIYRGGALPLPEPLATRAVTLAERAVACVPGLRGYVGVDLILGAAEDGSQDHAIEINPRLTTSYIGLRQLAEDNLAEALLRSVQGKEVAVRWRPGRVEFAADGMIVAG